MDLYVVSNQAQGLNWKYYFRGRFILPLEWLFSSYHHWQIGLLILCINCNDVFNAVVTWNWFPSGHSGQLFLAMLSLFKPSLSFWFNFMVCVQTNSHSRLIPWLNELIFGLSKDCLTVAIVKVLAFWWKREFLKCGWNLYSKYVSSDVHNNPGGWEWGLTCASNYSFVCIPHLCRLCFCHWTKQQCVTLL